MSTTCKFFFAVNLRKEVEKRKKNISQTLLIDKNILKKSLTFSKLSDRTFFFMQKFPLMEGDFSGLYGDKRDLQRRLLGTQGKSEAK